MIDSIFDYNPTPEEIKDITGSLTKEEYQKLFSDGSNMDLFLLFMRRRDYEKAKKYLVRFDIEKRKNILRDYWGDIIPDEEYEADMDRTYEIFKDIL